MLVLDALFDHIQQISSHVDILGSLVQCSPASASDVRVGSKAPFRPSGDYFRSTPVNGHRQIGPVGPVRAQQETPDLRTLERSYPLLPKSHSIAQGSALIC
jgi:hypothetical protein